MARPAKIAHRHDIIMLLGCNSTDISNMGILEKLAVLLQMWTSTYQAEALDSHALAGCNIKLRVG